MCYNTDVLEVLEEFYYPLQRIKRSNQGSGRRCCWFAQGVDSIEDRNVWNECGSTRDKCRNSSNRRYHNSNGGYAQASQDDVRGFGGFVPVIEITTTGQATHTAPQK